MRGTPGADLVDAGRDGVGHHLEVPKRRPPGRRVGGRVLLGGPHGQPPAGRHRHQDDPRRQEHEKHHRLQGHLGRPRQQHLPRPREDPAAGERSAELHAVRLAAARGPVRRSHLSLHRGRQRLVDGRARGVDLQDQRRAALLLQAAWAVPGECRLAHHQRLLQGGLQEPAHGVRGGGQQAARREPGREHRLMLSIRGLCAGVEGKTILKGIDLEVRAGEVHAVMGPNGSGKSTLAQVLAGHPAYTVTAGEVSYLGQDLLAMPPEERARAGVFLAFQYPVEIPGVSNAAFLKAAVNEMRAARGLQELDAMEVLELLEQKLALVEMDRSFLNRPVNEGFSGGEKKRNEILQMAVLEPTLAILDETDSGLDIDALRVVAHGINRLRRADNAIILVTHYQRILQYVEPDHVHVLFDGRIVKSAGKELALELERKGYDWIRDEVARA